MIDMNTFGILGGDQRQIALAESIAADGSRVTVTGFDDIDFTAEIKKADLKENVQKSQTLILPLPVTNDGKFLNMPYSSRKIPLDDEFAGLMRGRQVFGGMMGRLYQTSEAWESVETYDYYTREEFAVHNAVPTAEGAIGIAIREFPGTIHGSRCLISGYGRVGKALAWMLRGMGANVTVGARKKSDFAWIESFGYRSVSVDRLCEGEEYDIIFNTIPAMVFCRKVLAKLRSRPLMIDLSSLPGGIDFEAAEEMGIQTVHALSLPGKVAPKAAGEIIKNTIYNMMEE